MTITEKHIARMRRINKADKLLQDDLSKVRAAHNRKIGRDKKEARKLEKLCMAAYRGQVEKDHDCKCCDPTYPDSCYLYDDGTICFRYDADHPNDIVDINTTIEEILGT